MEQGFSEEELSQLKVLLVKLWANAEGMLDAGALQEHIA